MNSNKMEKELFRQDMFLRLNYICCEDLGDSTDAIRKHKNFLLTNKM